MSEVTPITKYCSGCGETKTLSGFYKNRTKVDGLQVWCKDCMKSNPNGTPREDQTRGVYLAVVKTIRGDFYVKVGKAGDGIWGFRSRAGNLAAHARSNANIDAEWAEMLYVIEENDAERREELEATMLALATPIIGSEYYHVSDYMTFLFAFARLGRPYTERTTYQARHDEFIEYLAKRDAAAWEKPPKKKRSLPNPFERKNR